MYQKGNYYRNKRYYTNKGLTLQKKPKDPPKIIDNYYIPIYRNYFLESGQLMERTNIVTMKFKLKTENTILGTLINEKIVAAGKTLDDIRTILIQPEINLIQYQFPSQSSVGNVKWLTNNVSATSSPSTSQGGYVAKLTNNLNSNNYVNIYVNYEIAFSRDDKEQSLWDMEVSKGEIRIKHSGGFSLEDNIVSNKFSSSMTSKTFTMSEYNAETEAITGLTSANPFNLYIYGVMDNTYYMVYEFTVQFF